MQVIKFNQLKLKNFKSHRDLTVEFGDTTKISGDNEKGKSSILEAITFTLYGVNPLGSKVDPTPIGYEFDEVLVELLLTTDETQVLLGRGQRKSKATYYINEVPKKATEFDELVKQLGDKELILSLLNPSYFPNLHWEKQRTIILQYVTAPTNKEVLKELPKVQADKLGELLKKHSLDGIKEIHKENKTKMDKKHKEATGGVKALKKQLESLPKSNINVDEVQAEIDDIGNLISEVDKTIKGANEINKSFNEKQAELNALQHQIDMSKDRWPLLKNEVIEDTCKTCQRPLDEETVKVVEADKEKRIAEYKAAHKKLTDRKQELLDELKLMKFVDVTKELEKVRELESKQYPLAEAIRAHKQHENLLKEIDEAEKDEQDKLNSLNESTFILDTIKAFRAKEAELQGDKVQKLFKNVSIKLYRQLKNGDLDPHFGIEVNDVPYVDLSKSRKIKTGIEVREVLSEQENIIAPCFVDDAESITKFKEPSGQLVISRVVAGQELKIESEAS